MCFNPKFDDLINDNQGDDGDDSNPDVFLFQFDVDFQFDKKLIKRQKYKNIRKIPVFRNILYFCISFLKK